MCRLLDMAPLLLAWPLRKGLRLGKYKKTFSVEVPGLVVLTLASLHFVGQ